MRIGVFFDNLDLFGRKRRTGYSSIIDKISEFLKQLKICLSNFCLAARKDFLRNHDINGVLHPLSVCTKGYFKLITDIDRHHFEFIIDTFITSHI